VKDRIRKLGNKEYWKQIETTPGLVVLFMPGENLLRTALESDPDLLDFGMEKKVILATPTTVIALLWAVKHGWNQDNLIKNIRKAEALGTHLYDALFVMTGYLTDLRVKLDGSVKAYNSAVGSFDYNVLAKARRLRDYGTVKGGKILPEELKPINTELKHAKVRNALEGSELPDGAPS